MLETRRMLFLHVPKTAGTSFRIGAVRRLGAKRCAFDYGRASDVTSPMVKKHMYEDPDPLELSRELERAGVVMLGGHFALRRFSPLLGCANAVAFCRRPEDQMMAHYQHFLRHNGYQGTLSEFLEGPFGAGSQTRFFDGYPLEAIGFIGVTERYAESLRLIEHDFGVCVPHLAVNKNPKVRDTGSYEVPAEFAEQYRQAAMMDAELYVRANALLDVRVAMLDTGQPYVHGAIQAASRTHVQGFAFHAQTDAAVTVMLCVNDDVRAEYVATDDRPGLRGIRAPRNAFVGFNFHIKGMVKPGDRISVRVASTHQQLGCMTLD